jgi:hypothetical protein
MQRLFETWWCGGLIVPLFWTVAVGGLVSILTGLCVARLIAFDQARMAAANCFSRLADLPRCGSRDAYNEKIDGIVNQLWSAGTEFFRLRQSNAVGMMLYLASRIVATPWVDIASEPSLPLKGDEYLSFAERVRPYGSTFSKMAFDLRPEMWSLIAGRWRNMSWQTDGVMKTALYSDAEKMAWAECQRPVERQLGGVRDQAPKRTVPKNIPK